MEDSGTFSVKAENKGGAAKSSTNLIVERKFRTLSARRAGEDDEGHCHYFRSAAKKEQKVIEPPSFVKTPQDLSVTSGQLARLDAKVSGTKPLDVYWLRNGAEVTPDITHKLVEEDDTYTLLILEVGPEDQGTYECVAINQVGEARCEAKTTVAVSAVPELPAQALAADQPSVAEPLTEVVVDEGQPATFRTRITHTTGM